MKKRLDFLLILLIFLPSLGWAMDFGMILDQELGYGGIGDKGNADYVGSLIPRVSSPFGDNGDIYVSGGVSAEYVNKKWTFIPELLRTEIAWSSDNWDFKAGRIYYSDPLGFIAEGLFDGAGRQL